MLVGLPFMIANYQWNVERISYNVQSLVSSGVHLSFADRLYEYFHLLPLAMSPILLGIFAASILLLKGKEYQSLLPIIVSAIGGVCLLCIFPCEVQDWRYLAPFLIAPAILTGLLFEKLLSWKSVWWRGAIATISILVTYTYIVYNFAPYPLPLPRQPWVSWWCKQDGYPSCYADWGYSFVLETIQNIDENKPVFLNILPNHDMLHVHAFELFFHEQKKISIIPTSSRVWSIAGDRLRFDPVSACWPMWYLMKTGDSGYPFIDEQSRNNYAKLINFVSNSRHFSLRGQKKLPDGSVLKLYRRII
jgi:hypothetical protein